MKYYWKSETWNLRQRWNENFDTHGLGKDTTADRDDVENDPTGDQNPEGISYFSDLGRRERITQA